MALRIPAPYYPQLVPGVITRGNLLSSGNLSNGTDTSGTYYTRHIITQSHYDTQIEFVNFYNFGGPDAGGANAITVRASLVDPAGNLIPLYFNGARSVVIQPGGRVRSDSLGRYFIRGQVVAMRTYVSVASAGMTWPLGRATYGSNSEGYTAGSDLSDVTTAVTNTSVNCYAPTRFLGRPSGASVAPVVWAVVGDSIADGGGSARDSAGMFPFAFGEIDTSGGYATINSSTSSAKPADFIWQRIAQSGDAPAYWIGSSGTYEAGPDYSRRRRPLLEGCTHVIAQLGVNGSSSALQMEKCRTLWNTLVDRGLKVWAVTLPPRTTSTDSFVTASNQTPVSTEYLRVAYNDWVRTTPAPLSGYIEIADVMEANSSNVLTRNGGRWYCTGSASGPTPDGVHPSDFHHLRAAGPIRGLVDSLTPRAA